MDKMEKIATALMPPAEGTDPTNWRWKVWIALMAMAAVGVFHISAEKGLIPGFESTAHMGDIKYINERLDRLETKQNVALRLQLGAEICRVYHQRVAETNPFTRSILNNAFASFQEDYASVNGGLRYSIAECAEKQ